MRKITLSILALLFAAGLVGIARAVHKRTFETPPAGRYTFAPPKDWVEVNPSEGLFRQASARVWQPEDPQPRFQTITLAFTSEQHAGQDSVALDDTVKGIKRNFRPGAVMKSEVTWACHRTQKVIFIESRVALAGFGRFASVVDQVQSLAPYGTYIISYSRPASEKQDANALTSLFSICRK